MRLTRGCNWSKISCKRRARGIGDGAEFESARKIWGGNLPPKGSIYGKCIEYVDLHGFLFSMVNLVHVPSITDGAPLGSENYRLSQLPPRNLWEVPQPQPPAPKIKAIHFAVYLHISEWHEFFRPSSSMVF